VRWAEACKTAMFRNMGPFEVGNVVSSWFEVAVKLEIVGWWYETFEDSINKGPEVVGVFRGSLEELLSRDCEIWVLFVNEEFTEAM